MGNKIKADITRLLAKKGNLSGWDAGRLVLADNVEVDHQRPGLLSKEEIYSIRDGLKTQQDIKDFNSLMGAYRIADYSIQGAKGGFKELQRRLLSALIQVKDFKTASKLRELFIIHLPAIVTQKQYEDIKGINREKVFREVFDLPEVLSKRGNLLFPEYADEYEEESEYSFGSGYDTYQWMAQKHPEAWEQMVYPIIELSRSGELQPIKLKSLYLKRLDDFEEQMESCRDNNHFLKENSRDLYNSLEKQKETLLLKLVETGRAKYGDTQKKEILIILISFKKKVEEGTEWTNEEKMLYSRIYFKGEDLYHAGLPEWIKEIEEPKPGCVDGDSTRGNGFAILQNPDPNRVDKNGYFNNEVTGSLLCQIVNGMDTMLADIEEPNSEFVESIKKKIEEHKQILRNIIEDGRREFEVWLGHYEVIHLLSEHIGVELTKTLEEELEKTKKLIEWFNREVSEKHIAFNFNHLPIDLKLPTFDIDDLKPSRQWVTHLKERMAYHLGKKWWERVRDELLTYYQDQRNEKPEDE